MGEYSSSIPNSNNAWLKDLIRSREAARLENGFRETSQATTATLPYNTQNPLVSISRNMRDFCVNTLNYIGEHPVEFALSIGAAMAVRWGVAAGLIAIGSGVIGGLALAIASSMITSVILGVGKSLLKGESLDWQNTADKALFSGVISGVIGAFLGGLIPAHAPDTMATTETLPYFPMDATPDFMVEGAKVTDQYAWKLNFAEWKTLEAHLTTTGESYSTIPIREHVTTSELLSQNTDWYLFENSKGIPYQVMHRDALQEMIQYTNKEAVEQGLPIPSSISLTNSPFSYAQNEIAYGPFTCEQDLNISTGKLVYDKDIYESALYHEFGHTEYYCGHSHSLSPHEREYKADEFSFKKDNYGGFVENHSHIAVDQGSAWDDMSDTHPATRKRLLLGIELAAQDPTFTAQERILFEGRLRECQQILDKARLPNVPDLLKFWQEALGKAAGVSR